MIRLKSYSILFVLLVLVSDFAFAQVPPVPNGRRLRTIVDDKYSDGNLLIGATTGEWAFNKATGRIMDREFNYVTPENDFKQHQIKCRRYFNNYGIDPIGYFIILILFTNSLLF